MKANQKVEIDPDAAEKLVVVRADFLHALANDVKPAFGASEEVLQVRKIHSVLGFLLRRDSKIVCPKILWNYYSSCQKSRWPSIS